MREPQERKTFFKKASLVAIGISSCTWDIGLFSSECGVKNSKGGGSARVTCRVEPSQ